MLFTEVPSAAYAAPAASAALRRDLRLGIGQGQDDLPHAHLLGRDEALDAGRGHHHVAAGQHLLGQAPEDPGLVALAHTDGAHKHIIAGHKRTYLLLALLEANHGDPQHVACLSKHYRYT